MQQVIEEGIASGELIPADPAQIRYAALGANVLYFLSAPLMRMIRGVDPLENGALEFRRTAAIQYLGQTIFVDRERGTQVAARVLAGTPMPPNSHNWPKLVPELRTRKANEVSTSERTQSSISGFGLTDRGVACLVPGYGAAQRRSATDRYGGRQ
jgi:hypothetical protein